MPNGAWMQDHMTHAHPQGLSTTASAALSGISLIHNPLCLIVLQRFDKRATAVIFVARVQGDGRRNEGTVTVHPQLRLVGACIVLNEPRITHTERRRAAATRKGLRACTE